MTPMSPAEVPADVRRLVDRELRRDGSRPLVTFYDDATGERTELSVVTWANWVAKTASLVQDELGVERGAVALVDLPAHWLGAVWLGALWSVGVVVGDDEAALPGAPDLVVCGPDRVAEHAAVHAPGGVPVVAASLRPMAGRFTEPLPAGAVDLAEVVWSQPDLFVPVDPPEPDDPAWCTPTGASSQRDLVARAAEEPPGRVLTDLSPTSEEGVTLLLAGLLGGGGTVWVRHADPDGWDRRAETERVDRVVRA